MKVDLFDYDLPAERIAQEPARPRDSARLLDLAGDGFADRGVADLPELLRPGDLLVVNDTRVVPSRLDGRRGAARIEATLHKRLGPGRWAALARPARRLRPGDSIDFAGGLRAAVVAREGGEVALDFAMADAALLDRLRAAGRMPLPPYIRRGPEDAAGTAAADRRDYQTMFAARDGAVAAPTASLHFTERLLAALEARGVRRATATLHVGAGTFLPVTAADTDDHAMHAEWAELGPQAAAAIVETRAAGGRIVAAGTTALRVLETAAARGRVEPFSGETALFVTPGHEFRATDLLLTNFHLPRSTLLMLVSAFIGRERVLAAYAHAIRRGYRFLSYGDACLMARRDD